MSLDNNFMFTNVFINSLEQVPYYGYEGQQGKKTY